MNQDISNLKVIRKPEVLSLLAISNATLYRLVNEKLLPPSFSLGCRAVGWYEHEVKKVIQAHAAGKGNEQVINLVNSLVAERQQAIREG